MKYEIVNADSIPRKNAYKWGNGGYKQILLKALELDTGEAMKFEFGTKEETRKFRVGMQVTASREKQFKPLSFKTRGLCMFVLKEATDAC